MQTQPAQVQPNANYLQQQQQIFTGNQTAQAEIQFPGGPFASRFDHQQNAATSVESFITQQVNAGGDKNHKDKMQRSCFQMSQKTNKATESAPKSSQSSKSSKQSIQPDEIINLYAIIPAEGTVLTYTKLRFSSGLQRRALVDTGAFANVISKQTFDELKDEKSLYRPLKISEPKLKRVRMAGGQLVPIETELTIEFRLPDMTFVESLLVLHAANSIILRNPFYKKQHIHICAKYNLLHFPDLTLQIDEIKPPNEPRRINRVKKFPLTLTKRQTIAPHQTILEECHLKDACQDMAKATGIVIPSKEFEEN